MYTHSKFSALAQLLCASLLALSAQNTFAVEQLPSLPSIGIESGGTPSTQSQQKVVTNPPVASNSSFIDTGKKKLPKAEILDTSENATPLVLPEMKSPQAVSSVPETHPAEPSESTSANAQQSVDAVSKAHGSFQEKTISVDTNVSQNVDQAKVQPKAQDVSQNSAPLPSVVTTSNAQQTSPEPQPTTAVTTSPTPNDTQHKGNEIVYNKKSPRKMHESKSSDEVTALTPEHEQFIKNETIMLMLEDEIASSAVSGIGNMEDIEVTPSQHIKLFWRDYYYYLPARVAQRHAMQSFVSERASYHPSDVSEEELHKQLFEVVAQGSVSDVRAMIDNYPLLQVRDNSGRNTLSVAVMDDNISVARFLLLRGIDLYALDYRGGTAFSIAAMTGNRNMLNLLKNAIIAQ